LKLKISACVAVFMFGCRTGSPVDSDVKAEFGPNGVPINWGSLQPMSTTPLTTEAKLANAAAIRLNEAARLKDLLTGIPSSSAVVDGVVSVPVKFLANDDHGHNHPFGDGQKNASLGWTGWSSQSSSVPLVSTLAFVQGSNSISHILVLEPSTEMIQMLLNDAPSNISGEISNHRADKAIFSLAKDTGRGVYRAVMTIGDLSNVGETSKYPAAVTQAPKWLSEVTDRWSWPRVKVRFFVGTPKDNRYWPILFRFPAQSRDDAQTSLPASARTYQESGKDISLPPYENVGTGTASQALKAWLDSQPPSKKTADFYPAAAGSGVHNRFTPGSGPAIPTATGGVDTYVMKNMVGKNQILFTCFDARDPSGEAQWGVPSGAGWHSIGHELPSPNNQPDKWTFAESVVNTMEKTGIFAGWGVRTPYPFSEGAPFEAKDVTTFRVLRSNEVFTTGKYHFHWYAIDAAQKACTIIWKHMGCALKSDRDLKCSNQ
jgi:hypothetical protein